MGSSILAIISGVFLLIAGILFATSKQALNTPPVGDGFGGKDTNNLAYGCLAPFVGIGFLVSSLICGIVAIVIAITGN